MLQSSYASISDCRNASGCRQRDFAADKWAVLRTEPRRDCVMLSDPKQTNALSGDKSRVTFRSAFLSATSPDDPVSYRRLKPYLHQSRYAIPKVHVRKALQCSEQYNLCLSFCCAQSQQPRRKYGDVPKHRDAVAPRVLPRRSLYFQH